MSARRYALIVAACLLALFVGLNLVANLWFKGARLDLTENQLYSLSRGSREMLRTLEEPVELKLFYSRAAAARDPAIQAYGARVRELLQSYAAQSNGMLRFVEVDPRPFTEAEDEAAEAGIEPLPIQTGGDPIYFGLVGSNAVDERRPIPYFTPEREAFIEYEITRLIYELQDPDLPKVALITALPIEPALAQSPFAAQMGQSQFAMDLGRLMDVTKLDATFSEIPADADVLAILHPFPLTAAQLYAIDQFILAKGRAVIALDPASLISLQSNFNPETGPSVTPPSSAETLAPLLRAWGVTMADEVVLDLGGALPVQVQGPGGQVQQRPQPIFFRIGPEDLDDDDLTTAWLQRGLVLAASGAFTTQARDGIEVTRLARTTGDTMRIPAAQALARPSPDELLQGFESQFRREAIALRLSGTLPSAFPQGPPAAAPAEPAESASAQTPEAPAAPASNRRRLTRSAEPAELILIADADLLADDFYVAPQGGGATFADNGAFVLNAIDMLSGSSALVSLRSRAPSIRPMTLIQRLESRAEQRIQARQAELQRELQRTEAQLAEMQSRGEGSGYFRGDLGAELTREEAAEIERFRRRLVEVRQELRAIGRNLRGDVDALKGWVTFINVWLAPLLVAGAGIYIFWRRQRRALKSQLPRGARS
ncbi:MAG: GldG family protein [Hydrogenophilaceae bacterium]|jgi:ABC-type uncharacterized transport system involved in gliding motility auxiliary subunit|nr:GldG family protein [Hydrogenophilaceae bacterium]